jgi:hypothetical protein
MIAVIFHGTERESRALLEALAHNCTCSSAPESPHVCPVHAMATLDQRAVDGLVFVRRDIAHYLRGEWLVDDPGTEAAVGAAGRNTPSREPTRA